ncbi:MAG: flagellar biosynthesis protein FlgJ, partial [Desulfobacteraceae bacterium]
MHMDNDLIYQKLNNGTLSNVKRQARDMGKDQQLKEACQGFEAIFLNTIFKSMRETLPQNTFLDGGHGQKMYQSMHDQYLSEKLAQGKNSL